MNIGNFIAHLTDIVLNNRIDSLLAKFCCATPRRTSKQKPNQCVSFVVLVLE